MLNLTQRLILGCVLLGCLTVGLVVATHRALAAAGQLHLAYAICVAAVVVAAATIFFVLRPIQSLARDAHRIAQGNLEHRVEWSSRDSFGVIASELNRIAVRLRELRDTEAGRRQMEFQLSDAVLQSIFEPIIVTDGKGHVLKVNQAAAELLGEAAGDRMALTNTPGGDKILSAIRDAVSMQKAVAAEDEASMLPMRIGQQERSYRLRTTPMRDSEGRLAGHGDDAGRRDQPAGHRPLQNAIHCRGQPQTARSAVAVAARVVCAGPGLQRRDDAAADRAGGLCQQGRREPERLDERPDRSGGTRYGQARDEAGADPPAARL